MNDYLFILYIYLRKARYTLCSDDKKLLRRIVFAAFQGMIKTGYAVKK